MPITSVMGYLSAMSMAHIPVPIVMLFPWLKSQNFPNSKRPMHTSSNIKHAMWLLNRRFMKLSVQQRQDDLVVHI